MITIAYLQSLIATLGSLYFSEILKYTPCTLCWYQRIAMYPIVVLLLISILTKDKNVYKYVLPLSITGTLISLYHNLLYYNIIKDNIIPCATGVSCTTRYVEYFGFITIPLLAFIAFNVINICMLVTRNHHRNSH